MLLFGIAVGTGLGFGIAQHQSMQIWGGVVVMSIVLASIIVGAIRERRLRKTLSNENHAA